MDETTLVILCSMCCAFSSMAVVGGLFVFKKDVCKKLPSFPILCKTDWSGGGGGGGGGGGSGTVASGATLGTPIANGTTGKANISTFGGTPSDDNGEGYAGFNLFTLGETNIQFQGKRVWPVAVYQGDAASYLYKVLEITAEGLPAFHGYVVDVCDYDDKPCPVNYKQGGLNFLIDIHSTAWKTLGIEGKKGENYFKTGTYKVVGQIRPNVLPKNVWMPLVQKNKDSMICSCIGTCDDKRKKGDVKWVTLDKCTA